MSSDFDESIGLITRMNKREFDHHIQTFSDGQQMLDTMLHLIGVMTHSDGGIKKTKGKSKGKKDKSKFCFDYINSSSMAVMIKHLITLKFQTTVDTMMTIVTKVDKVKNCLIYALLDYAMTLSNNSDGAIITENTIKLLKTTNLWIDTDKIDIIITIVNHFSPYFVNTRSIAMILANYPNLDHSRISIIVDNPDITPDYYYQQHLDTLNQKITKCQRGKNVDYFSNLDDILQEGPNYIVDGRNIFYDTAIANTTGGDKETVSNTGELQKKVSSDKMLNYVWKDHHMINTDKINAFINQYKDHHLVLVFYHIHRRVLKDLADKYQADSNFNVDFVFTKNGIDDDRTSLYLWLKNNNNILFSIDHFDDHVKHFHDDKFWYPYWKHHYHMMVRTY